MSREHVNDLRYRGWGRIIPAEACADPRAKIGPRAVAMALMIYAEYADHNAITWCPHDRMAAETGLTENEAYKARRVLLRLGYLVPAGMRNGRVPQYRLAVEAWPAEIPGMRPAEPETPFLMAVENLSGPSARPSARPSAQPSAQPSALVQTDVMGVDGRGGVARVREAARQAPPTVAEPTAPPLPDDPTGTPQLPLPPERTCTTHDTWKGDHTCWACKADREASMDHDSAVATYRAAMDAWLASHCGHGIANGVDGGCVDCLSAQLAADQKAADAQAAADAETARVAALPECAHGVPGGDTTDDHGRTAGACLPCEKRTTTAHARTHCDDPECHPLAVRTRLTFRYRRTATIRATG